MRREEIKIYSQESDNGVVHMPDRGSPELVMPGDSLFLLHAQAMDILDGLKHDPGNDMFYASFSLATDLEDRLEHYMQVCADNDIELSFRMESSVEDYQELIDDAV